MNRPKAPRRTRAQWQQLIDEFSNSSLTVAEFCLANTISQASFYRWRSKLSRSEPISAPWIDVTALSRPRSTVPAWEMELDLGNGCCLRWRRC
jgi:hypothetical protein